VVRITCGSKVVTNSLETSIRTSLTMRSV
jgi:hypothetical protein